MALDVGERWVGVAVSDRLRLTARPIESLRRDRRGFFQKLAELVMREEAQLIVVGIPYTEDQREGPQAIRIRAFLKRLNQLLPTILPDRQFAFDTWDEGLTSVEANERKGSSTHTTDSLSAAVLLTDYLQSHSV